MGEQESVIDYIAVDERLRKDVLDAKVMRRMFEGSVHYPVLATAKIGGTWEYGRSDRGRETDVS